MCMQAYEEQVQELERLRWILETSHMQHVTTLAWQAKQAAMLDSMQVSIDRTANAHVQVLSISLLPHATLSYHLLSEYLVSHHRLSKSLCHTICCLSLCVSESVCAVLASSPWLNGTAVARLGL